MLALPQTHDLIVFKDAVVDIGYAAGGGRITGSVAYVPPGELINVKFTLRVKKIDRCLLWCVDKCGAGVVNAKVFGTAVVDGAETGVEFMDVPGPDCNVNYAQITPGLPHLITVDFAKAYALDDGAYWITFDLVLTYTYELKGTMRIRAFRDSVEVSAWCVIEGVTSGYTPFYVDLDAGFYVVNCTYEGEPQTQTVQIKEGEVNDVEFRYEAPPPPTIWVRLRCAGVVSAQCVIVHDAYSDTLTVPADFTVSPAGDWTFRALGDTFEYWIVNGVRMDAREIMLTLAEGTETTLTMYFAGAPPPPPPGPSPEEIAMYLSVTAAVISIAGLIYSGTTYFMD